jgi:prevent-host-death family protein
MKPESIVPITELKRDAAGLIGRAAGERNPIVITQNGRATAVLQDIHSYTEERRAFALLKLAARGERDVLEGRALSHAEHRKRVRALLRKRESK